MYVGTPVVWIITYLVMLGHMSEQAQFGQMLVNLIGRYISMNNWIVMLIHTYSTGQKTHTRHNSTVMQCTVSGCMKRPPNLQLFFCSFFSSIITCICWADWAWSLMLLMRTESVPMIHHSLKFCQPLVLALSLLQAKHFRRYTFLAAVCDCVAVEPRYNLIRCKSVHHFLKVP